ncbi:motility associated factor glycosyltransferase family protein [Clostridium sp. Cult2]|uniref:motility associated factor glycosyltransferase family protein n=1 Tax=Clostridium sp. Cult2 TaxID=2079003 RepID=UPI001F3EAD48|nr:6-hydroxymethylpterin diphosphokinase MptE-like protein [Clostridium sp. Cult2]MCF6465086.1 hypothetical protein [Clostridium sp. Cult2]
MNEEILINNLEILKVLGYDDSKIVKPLEIEETKDSLHTYRYSTKDNKRIYIHSKYNIQRETGITLEDIDCNKDAIYLVYGLGLGYHIKELKNKISSRSFIFVIEKNWDIISTYLNYEDFSEIANGNIFFFFGDEDEILTRFNNSIFAFNTMPLLGNLTYVILPSYDKIYGRWIHDMNEKFMDAIEHAFFILGNDMDDTIIGIENNFENMKELIESPSIEYVKDKYKDIPAIIVSAGPSLDKNISKLKKSEGKALIIATDAVLTTLKNNDIVPDAVVSIERGMATYEKFYKDKDIDNRIVFIGPPVVRKEVLNAMKDNKKLLCLKRGEKINEWINNDILKENRLLTMGTSCAHVAFAFSQYVGANPIVFIGQDLSYTADGVTHSKDVEVRDEINIKKKPDVVYVKGVNGETLPTNAAFKNFLTWYEIQVAEDNSGREYIDATEGGALINGTKLMTLREVIDKYCLKEISRLNDIIQEGKFNIDKYNIAIEEIEKLFKTFDEIRTEAGLQILRLNNLEKKTIKDKKKLSNNDMEKIMKVLNKASKLENFILGNDITRTFFQAPLMMAASKVRMLGNQLTSETLKTNVTIQKRMVASIIGGCYAIQQSILEIVNNMKADVEN